MGRFNSILKRALRYIVKGVPVVNVKAEITLSSPTGKLAGKRIIITGGGRGLGASMAKKFVEEGASVLITGRTEDVLRKTSKELGCSYMVLDMRYPECFENFINEAGKVLGGLDVLVNNAGISLHEENFLNVTPQSFDEQFNTNMRGPFFLSQEFVRYLNIYQRKGNILFITSNTGKMADIRPYGLSKAAMNSFVKGLAYLLSPNIRVNALAPGITASEMTGVSSSGNLYYDTLIGRAYLADEIAEAALYLICDVSASISGEILTCDNASTVNARWK